MCNKVRRLCSTLPAENPEEYSLSKDIPPNLSKLFVNLLLGWLHILKQFPLSLVLVDTYNSAYIQTELYIYTLKIFKPNFSSSQQSSFITAVSASGQPIPTETSIARILDKYRAWQAQMTQEMALNQSTGTKGKGQQSGAMKGNCRNCGKKGHYIKDCWEKGGGKEGQVVKWFKQHKETDTAKQSNDDFALVTNEVTYATISASDWLADLATTTHIAWDKSNFIDYHEETAQI